jgi:hypothetical protein
MSTVLLEELKCFSIVVVGHVIHPADLFDRKDIHRASIGFKCLNSLLQPCNRRLFLHGCIGAQMRDTIFDGWRTGNNEPSI